MNANQVSPYAEPWIDAILIGSSGKTDRNARAASKSPKSGICGKFKAKFQNPACRELTGSFWQKTMTSRRSNAHGNKFVARLLTLLREEEVAAGGIAAVCSTISSRNRTAKRTACGVAHSAGYLRHREFRC